MSITKKSKSSSAKNKKARDRPFARRILAQARALVEQYQVVVWHEEGRRFGEGVELPNAMGDGETPDKCVRHTREGMTGLVAYMLEKGQTPPSPASENVRNEQVNLRVSSREKLLLEAASGGEGISEFVRAAALAAAGNSTRAATRQGMSSR